MFEKDSSRSRHPIGSILIRNITVFCCWGRFYFISSSYYLLVSRYLHFLISIAIACLWSEVTPAKYESDCNDLADIITKSELSSETFSATHFSHPTHVLRFGPALLTPRNGRWVFGKS